MKDFERYSIGNTQKRLISDEFYFRSIFKKTEKIVCTVSYMLSQLEHDVASTDAVRDLEEYARQTLSFVGDTLSLTKDAGSRMVGELAARVVLLESKLRVIYARGIIQADHLNVFEAEIDTLLRAIRSLESPAVPDLVRSVFEMPSPKTKRVSGAPRPQKHVREAGSVGTSESTGDRRDRIKAVLVAAQKASIKDITDTIKDCSEKTIQRELNAMIKDGLVVREGERRWSTYSYAG